jgi:catechol 2,3-dioxygenase
MSIHPDTSIGSVGLTVRDLGRARDFYERVIGLTATEGDDATLALSPRGEPSLVELRGDASAPEPDRSATGLFHLAILLPSRRDLALALHRLAEASWPLDGASDHLVSEAIYLTDPDGNGIEIYRDRPREEWPHDGGELRMATLPLDLNGVLAELDRSAEEAPEAPANTRMGHVHLKVSDIPAAEEFYAGALGFDVVVRTYPGALFVSAGGYHHHIGMNTWHSAGGAPPPPGAVGLREFAVVVPDQEAFEQTLERVASTGVAPARQHGQALVRDPSGNAITLTTRR